jgi:hypothetical protein
MGVRPSSEWNGKSQRPLVLALALQSGNPLLVALNQSLARLRVFAPTPHDEGEAHSQCDPIEQTNGWSA